MSISTLADFVNGLNKKSLKPLIDELNNEPSAYSVYSKLTKEDWKEFYGINGVHIFYHIHPQQGNLIPQGLFNILL